MVSTFSLGHELALSPVVSFIIFGGCLCVIASEDSLRLYYISVQAHEGLQLAAVVSISALLACLLFQAWAAAIAITFSAEISWILALWLQPHPTDGGTDNDDTDDEPPPEPIDWTAFDRERALYESNSYALA